MPPSILSPESTDALFVQARYLPIYKKFLEERRSGLYTRKYFERFRRFPKGPILFRTDKTGPSDIEEIKNNGLTKRNFWIIPPQSERPQKFGEEYGEFLEKLFLTWTWWNSFSGGNFKEDTILSFDLSELLRGGTIERQSLQTSDYQQLKRISMPCLLECTIKEGVSVRAKYLFGTAKLEVADFKKLGFLDFLFDTWALGLVWSERGVYEHCRLYEMLMKKFFNILAERMRLLD